MQLNPYGEDPVRFLVGLAARLPTTPAELDGACAVAGLVLDAGAGPEDVADVRAFVDGWLAVVDAPTVERRVAALNRLLAESAGYPRVTDHADGGWHIHYRDDDASAARLVRVVGSVGTALHLTGRGMNRLGRCRLAECGRAFADFSRPGRQRYCSHPCANRDAVRQHRIRRAAG